MYTLTNSGMMLIPKPCSKYRQLKTWTDNRIVTWLSMGNHLFFLNSNAVYNINIQKVQFLVSTYHIIGAIFINTSTFIFRNTLLSIPHQPLITLTAFYTLITTWSRCDSCSYMTACHRTGWCTELIMWSRRTGIGCVTKVWKQICEDSIHNKLLAATGCW